MVSLRPKRRAVLLTLVAFALTTWFLWIWAPSPRPTPFDPEAVKRQFPLIWKHVHTHKGTGGAWYIPPEWTEGSKAQPETVVEAVRLASEAALSQHERQIDFSKVPLMVHQMMTTSSARVDTWKPDLLPYVEQWLQLSVSPTPQGGRPMAYFFWGEEGILDFMRQFEPELLADFTTLFSPVERADIFRILVCQRFGGIYADLDTEPLRHPATWLQAPDISSWTDNATAKTYGLQSPADAPPNPGTGTGTTRPVHLIWGLEADTDPTADTYWRMGYTYPIQLTQWALASAPEHPALEVYMDNLRGEIRRVKDAAAAGDGAAVVIDDPLTRTGPAAVTNATRAWLGEAVGFRWDALTGLGDGGRAKLVEDVMVLPITGFSPGRGKFQNMGSKPVTDPDARLVHHALGSWRKFDLVVEYGKFCRTVFGMCREWSKVAG